MSCQSDEGENMTAENEPKLAPPGAGLPKVEHFIARVIFSITRMTGSRESFDAKFSRERDQIAAMVRSCTAESGARRVLIARPRGLEDSSRFWSVWMTLDHLRIVNGRMALVIASLAKGVVPPGRASTADVKPAVDVTDAVVEAYEKSCDDVLAAAANAPDLKSSVCFAHPWFGPLDAAGWHTLAGTHMAIHRVQLERILNGLATTKS
jgi:hypothetical protein